MRWTFALLLTGCYAAHERPLVCTDEAAPTDLPHSGVVAVVSFDFMGAATSALAGGFDDATLADLDAYLPGGTVIAREGDCVALGAAAVPAMSEDGGDLTATVGVREVGVAHATRAYQDSGPISIADDDVVQLTTSGGVVPPFAACVTLPAQLERTVLPSSWPVAAPLVVVWHGASDADTVELSVGAVVGGRIQEITCRVAASAGRIEVPASFRSMVSTGAQVQLLVERTHVVRAGDFAVRAMGIRMLQGLLTVE